MAKYTLCYVYSSPSYDRVVHVSSQMWEKAIELGKQLAKMHESHMFDFMELSQLLVRRDALELSTANKAL